MGGMMLEEISSSTSAVMSGTGQEVARQLYQTPEQKIVAVTFPDDEHGRAAEQVIRRVMEFLPQLIRERQQETLNKLTDAFLVSVTPPKRLANRLVRTAKPRQRR
jgi:predicted metalloprotease with PDZ domain